MKRHTTRMGYQPLCGLSREQVQRADKRFLAAVRLRVFTFEEPVRGNT